MNNDLSKKFIDDFSHAERLCNDNKLSESLEIYQALLLDQPDHISVLNNIGLVYEKMGNFKKGIEYYKKCNDIQPGQVILINNLANVYVRAGQWEKAISLLEKIINVDYAKEKNSERYALCLFNVKSKEETRNFINNAITNYPDNHLLNRVLGRSLLYLNSHVEGLRYLQKGAGVIEFSTHGVKYLN